MKYQLILQWSDSLLGDYDLVISIEDALIERLPDDSEVDGHDMGSGEVNIFILTDSPERDFSIIREIIADKNLLFPARAAFREVDGDDYKVLWPIGENKFSVA
jgi:hypothetical protein